MRGAAAILRRMTARPRGFGFAASCALALSLACAPRALRGPDGNASPSAIRLIESRPVGTALGNPALEAADHAWLNLIRGSQRTLDIEQFYVSRWPGEPLDPVLDEIGRAAKRGVRVRLLVDARMHRTYPRTVDSLANVPGIEVRRIDYGRLAGGVQHAKFFVVDGATVVLGSQNFDWRALAHIHELGVVILDRRVAGAIGKAFELDWAAAADTVALASAAAVAASREHALPPGHAPSPVWRVSMSFGDSALVRASANPLSTVPDSVDWDRDAIQRLIDGARGEVVAAMLSYSIRSRSGVDSTLHAALRRAAVRGVRVRLIVSDWQADSPSLGDLKSLARTPGIEVVMSRVPEWSGGYIPFARVEHCKFLVADTLQTWIGTSNWGPDYFHESRNVGVTIENRTIARQARATFETSWTFPNSVRLHPDSTYAPRVHGEEPPPGAKKYGG